MYNSARRVVTEQEQLRRRSLYPRHVVAPFDGGCEKPLDALQLASVVDWKMRFERLVVASRAATTMTLSNAPGHVYSTSERQALAAHAGRLTRFMLGAERAHGVLLADGRDANSLFVGCRTRDGVACLAQQAGVRQLVNFIQSTTVPSRFRQVAKHELWEGRWRIDDVTVARREWHRRSKGLAFYLELRGDGTNTLHTFDLHGMYDAGDACRRTLFEILHVLTKLEMMVCRADVRFHDVMNDLHERSCVERVGCWNSEQHTTLQRVRCYDMICDDSPGRPTPRLDEVAYAPSSDTLDDIFCTPYRERHRLIDVYHYVVARTLCSSLRPSEAVKEVHRLAHAYAPYIDDATAETMSTEALLHVCALQPLWKMLFQDLFNDLRQLVDERRRWAKRSASAVRVFRSFDEWLRSLPSWFHAASHTVDLAASDEPLTDRTRARVGNAMHTLRRARRAASYIPSSVERQLRRARKWLLASRERPPFRAFDRDVFPRYGALVQSLMEDVDLTIAQVDLYFRVDEAYLARERVRVTDLSRQDGDVLEAQRAALREGRRLRTYHWPFPATDAPLGPQSRERRLEHYQLEDMLLRDRVDRRFNVCNLEGFGAQCLRARSSMHTPHTRRQTPVCTHTHRRTSANERRDLRAPRAAVRRQHDARLPDPQARASVRQVCAPRVREGSLRCAQRPRDLHWRRCGRRGRGAVVRARARCMAEHGGRRRWHGRAAACTSDIQPARGSLRASRRQSTLDGAGAESRHCLS